MGRRVVVVFTWVLGEDEAFTFAAPEPAPHAVRATLAKTATASTSTATKPFIAADSLRSAGSRAHPKRVNRGPPKPARDPIRSTFPKVGSWSRVRSPEIVTRRPSL